jgi:transglutaminase-like putative cysteine protease
MHVTILSVKHVTTYRYVRPVAFGEHKVMFRPRDSFDQRLLSESMTVTPEPRRVRWLHDVFGNCVAVVSFAVESDVLRFDTQIVLDHTPESSPAFVIDDQATEYPFQYDAEELPDLGRLIERSFVDPGHHVDAWVRRFLNPGHVNLTAELLMTITYAIRESFVYTSRHEPGTQSPAKTLATGRGTCRDFAVLMMDAVRSLGFAARFVSGYIHIADESPEPDLQGGGNTHAWCQVYLPGAGWVEFDPTNGIVGNANLIRVAVARDARQATPLWGSYFGTRADSLGMEVSVMTRELKPAALHTLDHNVVPIPPQRNQSSSEASS